MISFSGGWYDAGDYNKYIVNSAYSIGLMHDLCPLLPRRLFYPSTGQHPKAETTRPICWTRCTITEMDADCARPCRRRSLPLTTPSFEGFIAWPECRQPRYVVQKSVTAGIDYAAALAQASALFSLRRGRRDSLYYGCRTCCLGSSASASVIDLLNKQYQLPWLLSCR